MAVLPTNIPFGVIPDNFDVDVTAEIQLLCSELSHVAREISWTTTRNMSLDVSETTLISFGFEHCQGSFSGLKATTTTMEDGGRSMYF